MRYLNGTMSANTSFKDQQKKQDTADIASRLQKCSVSTLEHAHPADGATCLATMDIEGQLLAVSSLPVADAAAFIAEMESHDQAPLIRSLSPDYAADILAEMSPDDAADILEELDSEHQQTLLDRVEQQEAVHLQNLLAFDPDTAGGVMNTEVTVIDHDLNVDEAIGRIRSAAGESEIPYYAYIVDEQDRLEGVLSLRDLMLGKPRKPLREMLANQQLITVPYDLDQEEVAHTMSHYNFVALPVVDRENRLLGVVTHDDIIDIIHEEASEDMLGMVGAGQDETAQTPWLRSVCLRLPWLAVNVANSAVAAWVVHQFEGTIAQMALLAALMPIVANQAGNAGHQSLVVIIRQLAMAGFDRKKSWLAIGREAKIGLVNGLVIGLLVLAGVFFLTDQFALACVMAAALGLDMVLANIAGAMFPVVLKELGRDPAQASSIFLTTVTDSAGFFLFLGLAELVLF